MLWVKNWFWAFLVCVLINIAVHPSSTVLGIAFFVLWIGGTKIDQARRRKQRELAQPVPEHKSPAKSHKSLAKSEDQMGPTGREDLVHQYIERQPWGQEYLKAAGDAQAPEENGGPDVN